MIEKIAVFTSRLSYSVRKGIVDIVEKNPHAQLLIAHQVPTRKLGRLLRNQWINTKKHGWRWIPYETRDIVEQITERVLPARASATPRPGDQYDWSSIEKLANVEYHSCSSLHQQHTLAKVAAFNPDLGISLAAPILKESLFALPNLGTINLHKGKVPFYRGMPPAFWELWNGEQEVGCTVHKVEAGLDTGDILLESTVPVAKFSTVGGMQSTLDELGVTMMTQAVEVLRTGNANWTAQQAGGKTFRSPTLKQQKQLNRRLASAWNTPLPKRVLKDSFFVAYSRVARPIPRRLLAMNNKQRVVVLLYHRVNDDLRDGVTVGIEQFDRHMAIISRHYPVATIDDIIAGKVARDTSRPVVAVTFDDGYLDNYQNAVPILLKHKVPAAFFVSTGIVGTENGFAHDMNKLGKALPNMSWDQIKRMRQLGFTIGSHTVTHINCAKDDQSKVREEISASKQMLIERLGQDDLIFAYPFGGKDDMNQDMLEYVRETRYSGCVSAYGGVNKTAIDPFNVLRMGIASNFTDAAFRARLDGFAA